MAPDRIALVTGANQGVGKQVASELAKAGVFVYVGSRDFARGEAAAAEIGEGATAIQIDVTGTASIAAAAARIESEHGRLDLLVNNAGISTAPVPGRQRDESTPRSAVSTASLDEIRAVWEVNVFGVVAVYQAMLPLLRLGHDARIVNVSSGLGSLAGNADPAYSFRSFFGPVYPASKAAENAMTLAMMIELEDSDIKVNLVSPGFTSTALNNFQGTETIEEGSREVVRVALLGPDGPSNTFTRWEDQTIPW
ncbi:SDR family NAD(P)-dependent oxidoreductase [Frondihabitans australicus]|uniref:NADP-dependent 3-hydroxy acid dehydrogenase YdfG n=1 Tax=Frondihabitans australicus TaxID=386892 RepID=A0A495IH41_9MICO|nr:SDR family NAD(P)-dependent oxidoreductase [Frondihabitans australicus]RKR75274.1 NADP-dependent 3-hydroxy acid dehydrogenase YdfG [Frondihabitans australicus]